MFGSPRRYLEVMRSWIKRHWRWALPVAAALVAVGAWLFFSFFAFQTYFIDDEVDEALPFFTAGPAPSGMEGDETTEEQADAMNEAMAELEMPEVAEVAEPMPEMSGVESRQIDDTSAEEAQTSGEAQPEIPKPGVPEPEAPQPEVTEPEAPEPEAAEPEVAEPQIIVEAAGSFVSRSHPTDGSVQVLGDGSGQRFLRLEDFRTDNGPDLNVYLSTASADAPAGEFDDDFVDLGDLKGNVGAQNYEIPVGVDLDHYSTVAIWCVRFGVVFGAAGLTAP